MIIFRGSAVEKRAKKDEGGLLSGWSNKLAKQKMETISGSFSFVIYQSINSSFFFSIAWNTLSHEASEDQDDPLEYAGGEFDEDERVELVRAARDVKKSAISV